MTQFSVLFLPASFFSSSFQEKDEENGKKNSREIIHNVEAETEWMEEVLLITN